MHNENQTGSQPSKRSEIDLFSIDYAIQMIVLIAIGLLAFSFL